MVTYRFKKKIIIKNSTKLSGDILADIMERAEEKAFKKLISEVGRHFIVFLIDSDISRIERNKNETLLIVDLKIELEISPMTRKIIEQDKIAEEVACEFIGEIEREVNKVLAGNNI